MVHLLNTCNAVLLQGMFSKLQLVPLHMIMIILYNNSKTIFTINLGMKTVSVRMPYNDLHSHAKYYINV